jgi:hypothetical protein
MSSGVMDIPIVIQNSFRINVHTVRMPYSQRKPTPRFHRECLVLRRLAETIFLWLKHDSNVDHQRSTKGSEDVNDILHQAIGSTYEILDDMEGYSW